MGLEVEELGKREDGWSGGVHVTLDCARDEAWAIFADFGGLCKWNPAITVCDLVEGKNNEPGSVRYCRGTLPDSWVFERLLVHDEENHLCKYQMECNRFRFRDGVQGYVSHFQFRDVGNGKTFEDWTYSVATQTCEQLTTFMTGFDLYNLNILQSAANARTSSLNSDKEQQSQEIPHLTARSSMRGVRFPFLSLLLLMNVNHGLLHLGLALASSSWTFTATIRSFDLPNIGRH